MNTKLSTVALCLSGTIVGNALVHVVYLPNNAHWFQVLQAVILLLSTLGVLFFLLYDRIKKSETGDPRRSFQREWRRYHKIGKTSTGDEVQVNHAVAFQMGIGYMDDRESYGVFIGPVINSHSAEVKAGDYVIYQLGPRTQGESGLPQTQILAKVVGDDVQMLTGMKMPRLLITYFHRVPVGKTASVETKVPRGSKIQQGYTMYLQEQIMRLSRADNADKNKNNPGTMSGTVSGSN
jgi:hypothetical protein